MNLLISVLLLMNALLALACQNNVAAPASSSVQTPVMASLTQDSVPVADTLATKEIHPVSPIYELQAAPSSSGTPIQNKPVPKEKPGFSVHPGFTELIALEPSIDLDIRYATTDNFTKAKIYDCPRCLLRPEAAAAIVKAQKMLQKKGLGLKMFDCYRPRPYQQRLWDKVPNPDYVTPPVKGSMHSRGAAVDLTIVDANGRELDMGTPYDFFGVAAHTDHTNLPAKVLENRRLLRETLATVGFKGIRTEWWHFSFQGKNYPLSDYVWPCDK